MRKGMTLAVAVGVLTMALAGPARAQGAPAGSPGQPAPAPGAQWGVKYEDPTAQVHDGFFLRFHLGPAGFATSASAAGDELSVRGSGGGFSFALGGAINPRVVIYGEIFADMAVGPTLEQNGEELTTSDDVSAGVIGFGPGIAYYFPSNLYLSATLGLAQLTVQVDGEEVGESETGFGVSAALGKEWWVSPQWGLGIAGQLFMGSIPDGGIDANWQTAGVMLAFSATCN